MGLINYAPNKNTPSVSYWSGGNDTFVEKRILMGM